MEKRYSKVSETKEVALMPHADFTMKDLEAIEKFKEGGMLGLHTIKDIDVERSMALYIDGKTYRQIASVLKIKKDVILFLANKFKWFELRKDYLEELHVTIKDKIVESKLQSQEFMLELILAYQKKISRNIHQYLRTDNAEFVDKVDVKDINTLLKVMEMIHKLDIKDLGHNDKPLVGLGGLGEGMTITKTGNNSVEITPKAPSPFSSKLKQFADLKRQQEKESQPVKKSNDIIEVETQNKESEK